MRHKGYFGNFGGQFVPELLMPALYELEEGFNTIAQSQSFKDELFYLLQNYAGRPTPLYFAKRLTEQAGGARILLKREDLNHTGSHKLNNCLGQALLARKMGKQNIIAETGAGQHGVATATVCALMGMKCRVFMGTEDIKRQQLNVFRMKLVGAEVVPVTSGTQTLKDATSEAMRAWISTVKHTQYILGSVVGPHRACRDPRRSRRSSLQAHKRPMLTDCGRCALGGLPFPIHPVLAAHHGVGADTFHAVRPVSALMFSLTRSLCNVSNTIVPSRARCGITSTSGTRSRS